MGITDDNIIIVLDFVLETGVFDLFILTVLGYTSQVTPSQQRGKSILLCFLYFFKCLPQRAVSSLTQTIGNLCRMPDVPRASPCVRR